jgi:hypothetical protein
MMPFHQLVSIIMQHAHATKMLLDWFVIITSHLSTFAAVISIRTVDEQTRCSWQNGQQFLHLASKSPISAVYMT